MAFLKFHSRSDIYKKAITYFNRGMYQKAIERFQEILKRPMSAKKLHSQLAVYYCTQAHYYLGLIYFALGNYSFAAVEFENALQLSPERREIFEYLGLSYYLTGQREKAFDALDRMAVADPAEHPAELRLASTFHDLNLWDQVHTLCREVIRAHPDYADAHFHHGLAHLGQGERKRAAKAFDKAVAINPKYWEARIKLGITQTVLGDAGQAHDHFKAVLNQFSHYADVHYYQGVLYASLNENDRAMGAFRKALALNPKFAKARIRLALLLWGAGQWQESRRQINEGIRLMPFHRDLKVLVKYFNLVAENVTASPQNRQSRDAVEEIVKNAFQDENKNLVTTPSAGDIVTLTGRIAGADARLDQRLGRITSQVRKSYAAYPDCQYRLGAFYLKLDQYEDAEAVLKCAIEVNPDYVNAHLLLFKSLKAQGRFEAALKCARILEKKGLPYPDFHMALGEVLLALKQTDRAKAAFERVLEIGPNNLRAKEMLAGLFEKPKEH